MVFVFLFSIAKNKTRSSFNSFLHSFIHFNKFFFVLLYFKSISTVFVVLFSHIKRFLVFFFENEKIVMKIILYKCKCVYGFSWLKDFVFGQHVFLCVLRCHRMMIYPVFPLTICLSCVHVCHLRPH